jgi:SAM-dependent methyltransferase
MLPMASFPIAQPFDGGVFDSLAIEVTGIVRVVGWSRDPGGAGPTGVEVWGDGQPLRHLNSYRVKRPDVAAALRVPEPFLGFVLEYVAPPGALRRVEVRRGAARLSRQQPGLTIVAPHYAHLFDTGDILNRDGIYGVGPPVAVADADVVALASALPGTLLDLGCGSGALVRALRAAGRDARGIEIDRPAIVDSLRDDVRPFVTLYDGRGGLPFEDGSFASVVCSEVLEHMDDPLGAIREIGRVASSSALITVPDMSAIPLLSAHGVVPWHLLEASHFNFFTQASLHRALSTVFPHVRFARLGEGRVNGTTVFQSLVAICERRSPAK